VGSIVIDIQTFSIAIASASVVAGVIYSVWQIRHQTKIRQTDLVMRLYSDFGRREFLEANKRVMDDASKDYKAFLKEYGWTDVVQVGTFYEGIGVLLKRRLIDLDLVDDLFSEPIRSLWGRIKPIIEEDRKRFNQPRIFEWFEYLYNEMQKREQRQ
jgi:hypothetical protein